MQAALITGVLGIVGIVVAALIGNAGKLSNVLPGNPTDTVTVAGARVTVTTTVTAQASGTGPAAPVVPTGRSIQWGPGTVLAGAVDFDPSPPVNSASGAEREIVDSSGNSVVTVATTRRSLPVWMHKTVPGYGPA